jgi:hypothetical protein
MKSRVWILGLACAALGGVVACNGPTSSVAVRGEKIFEDKCAACHGKAGQGVEGKYAEALTGDWPLPKLAHYIAKNMPDDDPETLSASEASAVAAYVFDAFYSRAAQVRNNPARVELAHLTNQQYAIVVADLLRQFTPSDPATAPGAVTAERGLSATYYNAAARGRFDSTKIVHQGIDPQLEFVFAEGSDARAKVGAAEFSMQWRGAVRAEETGDYEFVIRTPNSVRVWINSDINQANPTDAVLDVNVSRPDNPDHRVTVRLLGGRSYPIAIDYWALPEKPGAPPPAFALRWKPPHGSERTIPARNLSPAKVKPTFVVATRFTADDSSQGYERSGSVSKAWEEATTRAAFEIAGYIAKKLDRFAGTTASDATRRAKIEAFAAKFVSAAFRHPLTPEETRLYVTERFADATDPETAIKRVVLLALKSPQFLYVELPRDRVGPALVAVPLGQSRSPHDGAPTSGGPTITIADDFTIASRLAFSLWDSLPDAELAQAAAAGHLRTRAEVSAQANRMLTDPRARAKLREFFHHWLNMRFIEDIQKDAALYPDFTPEVIDDLRTSLDIFLDAVAWSERSDFRELLRADYLFVNDRLAQFYGLETSERASGDFVRVATTPTAGERSGVLTHPYLLAALSYKSSSSPIHRGVFLTRNIVGRALKPPPMAQTFDEAQFTPDMTMREKVAKLTRSENCQGCHSVINPLGFSLEWYDAVGRYRREENGRPIDAASDYATDDNQVVRLNGARDVAEFALANERANFTFIEQLFHHVVKQPVMAYGSETLPRLRNSFIASGYNLQKLLVEIVSLHALRGLEPPAVLAATPRTDRP